MRNLMSKLWNDDGGAIIAAEFVLVATILVLGLVVGLKAVNLAINNELAEVASAFGHVSQTYRYCGTTGKCASTNGSSYSDELNDFTVSCLSQFDSGSEEFLCQ